MAKKIKVLFFASEPSDTRRIRVGEELREIEHEIWEGERRGSFELKASMAVRPRDLQKAIMRHRPHIVHFSGHGNKEEGIFLEDEAGEKKPVRKQALKELFDIFKNDIRIVFLNACYSKFQIDAFTRTIDFTIGMKAPIGDKTAIVFAAAFYGALSRGHSVEIAFRLAKNLVDLDSLPDSGKPVLLKKKGADASKISLAPKAKMTEPGASLWIHGWVRRIYDSLPTVELDWTKYFHRDSRRIPSQRIWNRVLWNDLARAREKLAENAAGSYIDFRGKLPLTAVLAVGASFPEVNQYRFRAEQPVRNRTFLWRSDARPSNRTFKICLEKKRKASAGSNDILIALAITGNASSQIERFYKQNPETFGAMVYAEPDNGPGDACLKSDRDAVALAIHAKELIKNCREKYKAARTHLILYAPATFCLFLGQRLNALGDILTYERTAEGGYQPSLTIKSG